MCEFHLHLPFFFLLKWSDAQLFSISEKKIVGLVKSASGESERYKSIDLAANLKQDIAELMCLAAMHCYCIWCFSSWRVHILCIPVHVHLTALRLFTVSTLELLRLFIVTALETLSLLGDNCSSHSRTKNSLKIFLGDLEEKSCIVHL
jgi:hypothetical protein